MGQEDRNTKDLALKPMKCELNFLSKSDGSAILSQGRTVTVASVNGPQDVKMQNQNIETATLEVIFSSKGGKPCVEDRFKENAVRKTCEAAVLGSVYPRSGITITIQELEDYGGLLSCCVNSVCLALLNSGIAMRHVFAAVTSALDQSGNVLLEPSSEQLETTTAVFCFVFDSREKSLVTICFRSNRGQFLTRCVQRSPGAQPSGGRHALRLLPGHRHQVFRRHRMIDTALAKDTFGPAVASTQRTPNMYGESGFGQT